MSPRRRTPLTTPVILEAAAKVIERLGPDFSMRALGAELKVEAMSLYHHFPSKGHLLDALLDQLVSGIALPNPRLPWRERVEEACWSYRRAILSRPGFAHFALTHRMNTPTTLRFLETVIVGPMTSGEFSAETGARAFRAVGYYLMGALLDETAGYAKGPSAAEPVPPDQQRELAPTLLAMAPWFQPKEWERTFAFGLKLLLDSLEPLRRPSAKSR